MPVILVLDFGRFELSGEVFKVVEGKAASLRALLKSNDRSAYDSEYHMLLELLRKEGVALSFADARPPEFVLPSPAMDFETIRALFIGSSE